VGVCARDAEPRPPPFPPCSAWTSTAALRTAAATALLVLPQDATLHSALGGVDRRFFCGVVPTVPAGQEFRPPVLKRAFDRSARMRYVVSDAGLAEVDVEGDVHFSPWSEIEAVLPDDGGEGFLVVTRDVCLFPVDPAVHGRAACAAIRARLPERLWVRRPVAVADVARTAVPVG
jgi:hypothetical protein